MTKDPTTVGSFVESSDVGQLVVGDDVGVSVGESVAVSVGVSVGVSVAVSVGLAVAVAATGDAVIVA